ncbi:MAG: hypothetical protein JST67_00505 [Bacteroidetes bacterium]|nr:hypothetical protein [Bacteroidota bacterium]
MKEIKPRAILLFLLGTMLLLAGVSFLFPEEGCLLLGQKITFPSVKKYFSQKTEAKIDISNIVALAEKQDSLTDIQASDSLHKKEKKEISYAEINDPSIKLITTIQYPDSAKDALHAFFEALAELSVDASESIRILHYGDSQIEGDRITDYLRQKLQGHFGGSGIGWLAAMPVAQSVGIKQTWSDNWDRYTIFTAKDTRVKHNNYGIAAGFCRYGAYEDTVSLKNAWLKIKTNTNAGASIASYQKIHLFYANKNNNTQIQYIENNTVEKTDTLKKGSFNILKIPLSQTPNTFELKFKGTGSPDIYGLSLEGTGGVMIDNFGLRGSSGTFFTQMNMQHLKLFYDYLNTKFIILQFGGNTLPNILNEKMAHDFGGYLQAQIQAIKKIAPQASILVIGPSDMSIKEGENYSTYPLLEPLRDAIRQAAFNTHCAFFDMYDCMGGHNSMISWVEQGIAATDYIHFSPAGARKIAVLLYSALMSDYNRFVQKKKNTAY